ncbi:MAG: PleD family two-component system response regulator [Kiloniellales bacterium]|jgi:two-component system cell cycle response regulator|nr:PleD family two-component system response regulator [Kiloniellales bacterium]
MTARILVVDDILPNVKLLEAKLTAEYFDVLTANDGRSALERADAEMPDLILLDVMMPGMDGFEVCERLKANAKTRHIPVVMITALSDVNDRVRGLKAGADDFLSKPVNDVALFARVRSLARLKMMMDELRVRQATTGGADLFESEMAEADLFAKARVLVVESSKFLGGKIAEHLTAAGCRVDAVRTGAEGLDHGRRHRYDLIIAGLVIGGEDGLRLCSQFRSQEETRHVPILLVLDETELAELAKGLDLGVTDYLIKPIDRNELLARARTQIRRRRYHDKLRGLLESSVSMAYTDPLTGVYNRRYMKAHLERKIMEIPESAKPVSVLMCDLDHFKQINDTYGHAAGDEVLKEMAGRVADNLRDFDMVARYGGEEFVVVMPATALPAAQAVAERLCHRIGSEGFAIPGLAAPLTVTASIGVASTSDPQTAAEGLLAQADAALYQAKHAGRNRVVVSQEAAAGTLPHVAAGGA